MFIASWWTVLRRSAGLDAYGYGKLASDRRTRASTQECHALPDTKRGFVVFFLNIRSRVRIRRI